MKFRLGNTWLVYNNLSLIIEWIRMHCRHFPSLQCDSNHGETKIEGEECGSVQVSFIKPCEATGGVFKERSDSEC